MIGGVANLMTNDGGLLARLADWTDRIAAGELPRQKPERPQGIERNMVVTLWDWSRPTAYLHDSDRHRQKEADRQWLGCALRLNGAEHGLGSDSGSGASTPRPRQRCR